MRMPTSLLTPLVLALGLAAPLPAAALVLHETPSLAERVAAGDLPPVAERVPAEPHVTDLAALGLTPGRQGGELRTLVGRAKDVRLMFVYGYARLVVYDRDFELRADILESFEVEEGRRFTLHLREGHRWSDGRPFTAEDFRYWWEDVANNRELTPSGPPQEMLLDGRPPLFEVVDASTVRYTWHRPNPEFLPRLAGASPLLIYRPAEFLKPFHAAYADPARLDALVAERRVRTWATLHNRLDDLYRFDDPNLPTLQPWRNTSDATGTRFVGERNPFFHRIDSQGRQLPYLDRLILGVADGKLIPAKAAAGEVDLQARGIAFNNYTFLKENEQRSRFRTWLWSTAKGSHIALFPNLNANDPVWRALFRDVRFRHALSLAIDRRIINRSLYFGLALESNNTVLPKSPLHRRDYQERWAGYEPKKARALLDEIGLTERRGDGTRLLPDGRPLEIIVETAGESTEETDVLELVRETWAQVGVKLYIKPSQRDVFRNRVFAGETQMSVWTGLENGVPTPEMIPDELAPTSQVQLMWPKWGQYYETGGKAGEPVDMDGPKRLMDLLGAWYAAGDTDRRRAIWHDMLAIHAEETYSIGIIAAVRQPVVVGEALRNVPQDGIYNWDPGALFGIYRPDTFWLDR